MHQDPEHEDYDDDEYNYYPQYNDYGYPYSSKKFDVDWAAWEKWLSKAIQDIVEEDKNVWVFGHNINPSKNFISNDLPAKDAKKDQYFMYLGSNHYEEAIWKSKYFVVDYVEQAYKKHIIANAPHFLKQPKHYKGLFEILN